VPELAVTLTKSPIGNRPAARATVAAIGLRRLHQTVIVSDTDVMRGMLKSVAHLVSVGDADGVVTPKKARPSTIVIKSASPVVAKPVAKRRPAPIAKPVESEAQKPDEESSGIVDAPQKGRGSSAVASKRANQKPDVKSGSDAEAKPTRRSRSKAIADDAIPVSEGTEPHEAE
jgi:large subunit ribosomal protein L30